MNLEAKNELLSIIDKVTDDYGPHSNAVLITKLHLIRSLISHYENKELINELINQVNLHYARTLPESLKDRLPSVDGFYISEFDVENSNDSIKKLIINIDSKEKLNGLFSNKWYIYIIDQYGIFRIMDVPVSTAELIVKRSYINTEHTKTLLVHPLLLENKTDKVKAAGEIGIIKDSHNKIAGALINNRSGHFKPHKSSLKLVRDSLTKLNVKQDQIYEVNMG